MLLEATGWVGWGLGVVGVYGVWGWRWVGGGAHVQLCKACSEFVVKSRWFFLEGGKRRGEVRGGRGWRGRRFREVFSFKVLLTP